MQKQNDAFNIVASPIITLRWNNPKQKKQYTITKTQTCIQQTTRKMGNLNPNSVNPDAKLGFTPIHFQGFLLCLIKLTALFLQS